MCMAHIRKFRTQQIWHLYSSLSAGLGRPADTMDEQLEQVMASATHDYNSEVSLTGGV